MFSFLFLIFLVVLGYVLLNRKSAKPDQVEFPPHLHWGILGAILLLNIFAYESTQGLGTGLFLCGMAAVIPMCRPTEKSKIVHRSIAFTVMACGLLFCFRANDFVQEINASVGVLGLLTLIFVVTLQSPKWSGLWLLQAAKSYVVRVCRQLPALLRYLLSRETVKHPALISTVKTFLITVALLLFFSSILSKADPIFADLIDELREQVFERTVLSLLLSFGLIWLLSFRLEIPEKKNKHEFLGFYETVIPTVGILILFAVFLLIQAKYLFGSHVDFRALDITYSEYVRKGFKELLTATFFGGIISYVVRLKTDSFSSKVRSSVTKSLNILLIVALMLLLASAFKRNEMYMEMYGLTRVRIVGEVFLAWLVLLLLHQVCFVVLPKFSEARLIRNVSFLSVCCVVVLNLLNIDSTIASATPPRNAPKDFFYINALSADAVEGWSESLFETLALYESVRLNKTLTEGQRTRLAELKLALSLLRHNRDKLMTEYGDDWKWQNFNLGRYRAYSHIVENYDLYFGTADCLADEIEDYQVTRNVELSDIENARLYDYEYPFLTMPSRWWYYPDSLESIKEQRAYQGISLHDPAQSCAIR